MTARYIKKHLVKFNEDALPDSFVALMVSLNSNKIPDHAGILIRLRGVNYFHHFSGRRPPQLLENFNPQHWFVYKIVNLVRVDDESEVDFFLHHCRNICKHSKMIYSCTLDGSHYNADGKFESASGLPELGTCVGFCLNTIALYAIDTQSFLQLEDWDESSIPKDFYLDNYGQEQTFKNYPLINVELYNASRKRITPTEYLCSAFFNEYPVPKQDIEAIVLDVLDAINEKF